MNPKIILIIAIVDFIVAVFIYYDWKKNKVLEYLIHYWVFIILGNIWSSTYILINELGK